MRGFLASIVLLAAVSTAAAQNPPASPKPPADQLPPVVEPIPLTFVRFDPSQLAIKRTDGRWQLAAGKQFLKDFGAMQREAQEALRLIQDLHFTQYGTIAGSIPAFEFWLDDGEGAKGGLITKNVVPFNARALKVEQTVGAWVVRDDKLMLYNFGTDEAAAKHAFAIMKKYGFNQLGVIGAPRPVMTYLTVDPYARVAQADAKVDPRETIAALAQQGLMLPRIGYVGGRLPIESRKLEVVKQQNEWIVAHGREVIGRFGMQETRARDALRILQDARVTEVVLAGKSGIPIFLTNGQAPRTVVLGFGTIRLNPPQMRVQNVAGNYSITEGVRTVLSFGDNRADAELMLKVLQHFQFDQAVTLGDPDHGGFRLFSRSR